jgi:hypothetical protein
MHLSARFVRLRPQQTIGRRVPRDWRAPAGSLVACRRRRWPCRALQVAVRPVDAPEQSSEDAQTQQMTPGQLIRRTSAPSPPHLARSTPPHPSHRTLRVVVRLEPLAMRRRRSDRRAGRDGRSSTRRYAMRCTSLTRVLRFRKRSVTHM